MLISIAGGAWRERMAFQSVLLKEVVIEPNVKLECVTKFCYLGDTLGVGGGRTRTLWTFSYTGFY